MDGAGGHSSVREVGPRVGSSVVEFPIHVAVAFLHSPIYLSMSISVPAELCLIMIIIIVAMPGNLVWLCGRISSLSHSLFLPACLPPFTSS